MMSFVNKVSGEEEKKCIVGDKEVPCPQEAIEEKPIEDASQAVSWEKHILPEGLMKDVRHDFLFYSVLVGVIGLALSLIVFKVKIFGKTLNEYIKPIWPYVIASVLIVSLQYLIGIPYAERFPYFLKISQGLWVFLVALSVIKLSRKENFNFGNVVFLGIIYSIVIHGLKVSIRYLFYEKTIYYLLDRFVYGSLLVMVTVLVIGPLLIYLRKRGVKY